MSEPQEVPTDSNTYGLLAWLYMELRFNGKITVDTWNKAIEKTINNKPPEAATAEGDPRLEVVEVRVANDERMLVTRFALDSERNAGSQQKTKWPIVSVDIHPEGLTTIDFLDDGGQHIRANGRVSIGDDLSAVNDLRHDSSLSVGDAPSGAGVGTSETTERVYQSYGTNQEKPPAGATAEGNETKNQR